MNFNRNKFLKCLVGIGFVFMIMPTEKTIFASYSGGSGTESDPYLIGNADDLIQLNKDLNLYGTNTTGKHYRLTADIDFKNFDTNSVDYDGNWESLGEFGMPFRGIFDGDHHSISNINILAQARSYIGFFGYTSNATIKNLNLKNISVNGREFVGGLIGYQDGGTVERSFVEGEVVGLSNDVGGLVGYQTGTINQSSVSVNINGTGNYVGGLVGYQTGVIRQSMASGTVDGASGYVGGLVGYQWDGEIKQSYSLSSVSGTNDFVGGLVGEKRAGTIQESYSNGKVKGSGRVGGLVGFQNSGTVTEGYWDVKRSGQGGSSAGNPIYTDGLESEYAYLTLRKFDFDNVWKICEGKSPQFQWQDVGCREVPRKQMELTGDGTMANPYQIENESDLIFFNRFMRTGVNTDGLYIVLESDLDFSGYDTDSDPGNGNWGPVGDFDIPFKGVFDGNQHTISNLSINVPSQNYVGFFGYTTNAEIENLILENISVEGNSSVGGLIGHQISGTTSYNSVSGNIKGNGYYTGGLIGGQSYATIRQNCTSGDVIGLGGYIGGLVGYHSEGSVSESYSLSSVNGNEQVGGLVGFQYAATIDQSYSAGEVIGNYLVGGLVGNNAGGVTTNSYWDTLTSGQKTSSGGTGLTTSQMTQEAALTQLVGFDFNGVWKTTNGYPELQWQKNSVPEPKEEEVLVNGHIQETIISLDIPTAPISFKLDPNQSPDQQFISSELTIINESFSPLTIELRAFEQVTNVFNDVLPNCYEDWSSLNKEQSKNFALAITPLSGDGWLSLNEGDRWVANLNNRLLGTIKGKSGVTFSFKAKHGTGFSELLNPQYRLTFVFELKK